MWILESVLVTKFYDLMYYSPLLLCKFWLCIPSPREGDYVLL